jgi:flagellar basal body rod protein FlgC
MTSLYSISAAGVSAAWNTLNQAAERIATGSVGAQPDQGRAGGSDSVTGDKSQQSASSSAPVDLVTELLKVQQAKIDAEANLQVMSVQQQLDRDTLDLLA